MTGFGELVYRQKLTHRGVILLRQAGLSIEARVEAIAAVLNVQLREIAISGAQGDELPTGDELSRVLDSAAGLTRYEAEGDFW